MRQVPFADPTITGDLVRIFASSEHIWSILRLGDLIEKRKTEYLDLVGIELRIIATTNFPSSVPLNAKSSLPS
jgi:hypothetical protein